MKQRITFDLQSPVKCTQEQFNEWLLYHLVGGSISEENPLSNFDLCGYADNLTADDQDID